MKLLTRALTGLAMLCAVLVAGVMYAPSPVVAQAVGFFQQIGAGAVVRTIIAKLRESAPTPQDFGAACDGVTDDTIALQAWLNNARNGSGLPPSRGGLIPSGVCIFKSALTMPVGNDYTIAGIGQSSELRYAGTSTTIDLITFGDGTNPIGRINLRDFHVTSSTSMTAGTALKLQKLNYSLINNVTIGDYGSTTKVYNGIWIKGGSFNSITNIEQPIAVKADAIRVNSGFELNIDNVAIVSSGAGSHALRVSGGFGGLYTGYVAVSGTEIGLLVDNADDATSNNQFFVSNRTTFDNNTAAGIYLNDAVAGNKSFSMLGWCSSATITTSGCFDIIAFANGNIQVGGGAQFLSNQASAIYYADSSVNLIIDAAAALSASGRYGVECTVSTSKVVSYSVQVNTNTLGNYSSNCNVPVLTANRLMVGGGAAGQPAVLPSLGTTTTVLHGNAAGNPSFGAIVNADLATMSANTVKGNGTIGAATPTDLAMPSCSTAASAVTWIANTGFSCNTSITAASATTTNQINGVDQTTAWTIYTPTLACLAGTLTTSSASGRYKTIGKSILIQITASLTTVGSCGTALTATLPVNANSSFAGVLNGRENALTGFLMGGYIATGGATLVTITKYDNTFAPANGWSVTVSGVYESN